MPLVRLPATEAVENRKTNPYAGWGDRGRSNRVEPMTLPNFAVPFRLDQGESIFTIGSCFARNVEVELMRRGFKIPARDVLKLPEFANVEGGIINNYGAPSIYNELAWAFDARPFVREDHLIEISPGKFADQHLSPSLRPEALPIVLARREAITASYRSAAGCRTIIMTLGLSEVWYDTRTECYLNVSPRPAMLRQFPERYELHVLSYEEVHAYLKDAVELLRAHCPSDLRMLLTVSPVPLSSTHRTEDVIVANSYSKSVLRTAAEAIVTRYPFVTYYPSYESVSLTERRIAWMDDLVHVSEQIVKVNVDRMLEAFAGGNAEDDKTAIEQGGEPMAILRAQAARKSGGESAVLFFAEHKDWCARSIPFALENARFEIDRGNVAAAELAISPHLESTEPGLIATLCETLLLSGRPAHALETIDRLKGRRVKSAALWDAVVTASFATNDSNVVLSVINLATSQVPARKLHYYLLAARALSERDVNEAIRLYRVAADGAANGLARLELANFLIQHKRIDDARVLLNGFAPSGQGEVIRYNRLATVLGFETVS